MTNSIREQILGVAASAPSLTVPTNAGSITLAWDRSPDVSVVGYRIYYGVASGAYTNSVSVGNVTNATLKLVPNTLYYFGATARNATGEESPFSNETSGRTSAWPLPVLSIRTHSVIVEATTVPGRTNIMQSAATAAGPWVNVASYVPTTNLFALIVYATNSAKFYRVKIP